MRVVATSDTHGSLPDLPSSDLLLLGGDILPDTNPERWLVQDFRDWMHETSYRRAILIAGNHDFYFESASWQKNGSLRQYFEGQGITYLQDSGVQVGSLHIWGTPWTNLPGWAFYDPDEANLRRVPRCDLLLSHSPPSGILDSVQGRHVGSKALSSALQQNAPRHHFFGHIHECGGQEVHIGATSFFNVAHLDAKMRPAAPALKIEI